MPSFEDSTNTAQSHPEFLASLVGHKMDRMITDAEVWQNTSNQVFENLPLSGGLHLKRMIDTDGTKGPIEMKYQVSSLSGSVAWYETVKTTLGGKVVYAYEDGYGHYEGQPLSGFRRAILTLKVLKGRPDHWERESDFNETAE